MDFWDLTNSKSVKQTGSSVSRTSSKVIPKTYRQQITNELCAQLTLFGNPNGRDFSWRVEMVFVDGNYTVYFQLMVSMDVFRMVAHEVSGFTNQNLYRLAKDALMKKKKNVTFDFCFTSLDIENGDDVTMVSDGDRLDAPTKDTDRMLLRIKNHSTYGLTNKFVLVLKRYKVEKSSQHKEVSKNELKELQHEIKELNKEIKKRDSKYKKEIQKLRTHVKKNAQEVTILKEQMKLLLHTLSEAHVELPNGLTSPMTPGGKKSLPRDPTRKRRSPHLTSPKSSPSKLSQEVSPFFSDESCEFTPQRTKEIFPSP